MRRSRNSVDSEYNLKILIEKASLYSPLHAESFLGVLATMSFVHVYSQVEHDLNM